MENTPQPITNDENQLLTIKFNHSLVKLGQLGWTGYV